MWVDDKNDVYHIYTPKPTANDLFDSMRKMCDEYDRLKKIEKAFNDACLYLSKNLTVKEDKTNMSTKEWEDAFLKRYDKKENN